MRKEEGFESEKRMKEGVSDRESEMKDYEL